MLPSLNNQLFAMEPSALESLFDRMASVSPELVAKVQSENRGDGKWYDNQDGTALIQVSGVLLRSTQDAQLMRAYGEEATSYGEIVGALAAANADHSVKRVGFMVDSPGGQVSGVHSAADAIAASGKPTFAHIQTLGASAAYWLASQTGSISAERGAMIGSIGAYMAITDLSAMAASQGIKVHVISSGPHKGAGVPGASINADQLAEYQARINSTAEQFVSDVSAGRGLASTVISESADGRVYSSNEAVSRGLIDSIAADPLKDFKMADALRDLAALVKEHGSYAALISERMADGADAATVRKEIEMAKVQASQVKLAADLAASQAACDLATKELVARDEKIAALEKSLADEKAAADKLKALGDGAAAAAKVKADPAAKSDSQVKKTATADEVEQMGGIGAAKFFASGGTISE